MNDHSQSRTHRLRIIRRASHLPRNARRSRPAFSSPGRTSRCGQGRAVSRTSARGQRPSARVGAPAALTHATRRHHVRPRGLETEGGSGAAFRNGARAQVARGRERPIGRVMTAVLPNNGSPAIKSIRLKVQSRGGSRAARGKRFTMEAALRAFTTRAVSYAALN